MVAVVINTDLCTKESCYSGIDSYVALLKQYDYTAPSYPILSSGNCTIWWNQHIVKALIWETISHGLINSPVISY